MSSAEATPAWRTFHNKIAEGVLFTNFAYEQEEDKMQELAESLPEGYELFLMTDHMEDSKSASFRCVAFVNQETKEVVFATAGTRPGLDQKGAHDLIDDAMLAAHYQPYKMEPAKALNDMVIDSLGEEVKDYKFRYTGHSLGAAMAEMQAADMDIKLTQKGLKREGDREQITAVTFENPGAKPIIEKMYEEADLPKENAQRLNFYEFNNRGNIINSLNEQTGRTFEIVPQSQKARRPSPKQMVFEFVAKQVSKLSPTLGKIFSLLAPGGIGFELVSDHAMSNFDEVFVKEAGGIRRNGKVISLEEAYSSIKPIEYDKQIADSISGMQKENGAIGKPEFVMTKMDPETQAVDRVTFSKTELQRATSKTVESSKEKSRSMVKHLAKKGTDSIVKSLIKENAASMVKRLAKGKTPKLKLPSAREVVQQLSAER